MGIITPTDDQKIGVVTTVTPSLGLPLNASALQHLDHRIAVLERRRFGEITLIELGILIGLVFMLAMIGFCTVYHHLG